MSSFSLSKSILQRLQKRSCAFFHSWHMVFLGRQQLSKRGAQVTQRGLWQEHLGLPFSLGSEEGRSRTIEKKLADRAIQQENLPKNILWIGFPNELFKSGNCQFSGALFLTQSTRRCTCIFQPLLLPSKARFQSSGTRREISRCSTTE